MTRVLVFGGREFDDRAWLWQVMDEEHAKTPFTLVIDGASDLGSRKNRYRGADYWANKWAIANGVDWQRFPANWSLDGIAAGPIRNKRMLREGKPDMGIEFPGGSGTAHMAALLRQADIPVVVAKRGE